MNANDFSGRIQSAALCGDLAGCYAGLPGARFLDESLSLHEVVHIL